MHAVEEIWIYVHVVRHLTTALNLHHDVNASVLEHFWMQCSRTLNDSAVACTHLLLFWVLLGPSCLPLSQEFSHTSRARAGEAVMCLSSQVKSKEWRGQRGVWDKTQ